MISSFTQRLKSSVFLFALLFGTFQSYAQTGSVSSPYTALGQAQNVTANGVYYFNLTGTTFSTYVITGGWVQVAFDYGNGVGNLPQVTALTTTARGILSPTVLSKLGSGTKVKITSDYTNFAITSSNSTHINRLINNQCLHTGTNDNGLQGSWTGNTSTLGSGCNSNSNNGLHQRIYHAACNGNGFHWVPKDNNQSINLSLGELPDASYFQLWVQAPMVAVINGPVINTQPSASAQNLCLNSSSAALSVAATGTATITYQWYSNTSPSNSGGTLISGATTSSYSPPTTVAGTKYYYVVATNPQGSTTSAVSGAIITSAASVAGSVSANQTICAGSTIGNITLTANTGSVQWQMSYDNTTFFNITGATGTTLTAAQTGTLNQTVYYRAIVTNSPCASATSATVTVTVNPIPAIATTTPASRCGTGTLALGATASSGTINWYAASSGGASLGTGTSYTTASISSTTTYYVDATLNGCTSSPRTAVVATINAAPTLATNAPSSLTLDVLVVGGGGGGSARHGGGGGGGQVITTTSTITAGSSVSVTVGSGGAGGQNNATPSTAVVAPNTAAYGVNSGGHGGTSSYGTTNALGGAGGPAAVSSRAGGNAFGPTNTVYVGGSPSWNPNSSTNGYSGGGGAGSGGNGTNSSPTGSTGSNATAGSGGAGISSSITGSAITYGGGGGGGCANNAAAAGNGTDGGGNGGKGAAGSNAADNRGGGGGGSGFNLGTNYTAGNGGSGVVIVRYLGTPQATGGTITQAGGYTIHTFTTNGTFALAGAASSAIVPNVTSCGVGAVTFTGTVSSGLTLDWYSAASGGTLLSSGTTSYTTPVLSANTTYYVEVRNTSTGCVSASRLAVTATINSVSTISANQSTCVGGTPAAGITLTSAAGTIQWQSSTNNVSFTNISGQTSATLSAATIGALTQTTYFRAAVTNGACVGNSPVHTITVNNPTFSFTPTSGNVIWRGATSTDWNTASNWYNFNGTAYTVASAVPTNAIDVIIPANQTCVLAQPSVLSATTNAAKNVLIETGATLTLAGGTLNVAGDWTNNGTFTGSTGTVSFNGTGTATLGGTSSTTFANLSMDKSGAVALATPVTVSGSLALNDGIIELGANNLTLGSASVSGGSATSYVKTASTGTLSRIGGATATSFPVGNSTYNPAELTNNGTSDVFSVRVIDNVTTNGTGVGTATTLAVVNRTWMISEATTGGSNASLRLYWNGSGEEINGFDAASAFVAHYSTAGSMWENMGGGAGAGYVQSTDAITSFSPFTISSTNLFAPLPVELLSFDAQCADQDIIVRWTTASEHNTLNFIVQRSEEGTTWNDVQTVEAAGNSNTVLDYAIQDMGAARGTKYYRLVQTDQDGVQKIYGPILTNCGSDALSFLTFPNPSTDEFTILFGNEDIHGDVVMTVSDATGKVVRNAALFIEKGTTSMMVPSLDLSPGVYQIQLNGENFQSAIIKHSLQ